MTIGIIGAMDVEIALLTMDNTDRLEQMNETFLTMIATEMEAAAVAQVCSSMTRHL